MQTQGLMCCEPELTASRRGTAPWQGWGKPRGQQGCGALLPEPWEGKEVLDQFSEPDSPGMEGGRWKEGWVLSPITLCCPTVLSSQDSPDASWEPMAKLSVSCVQKHQRPQAKWAGELGLSSLPSPFSTEQAHFSQPAWDQPLQLCKRRGR